MVNFDPDNDPRLIRSIECGLVDVAEETRALIPETEWRAALNRHVNLDFGDTNLEAWIGNLFGITMGGSGTVESSQLLNFGEIFSPSSASFIP